MTTGISASDRATTIRPLACADTDPAGLRRPGHVYLLREAAGSLTVRQGHTEAAVALCRLGGIDPPVGALVELVNDDGTVMRTEQLASFARERGDGMSLTRVRPAAMAVDRVHRPARVHLDGRRRPAGDRCRRLGRYVMDVLALPAPAVALELALVTADSDVYD